MQELKNRYQKAKMALFDKVYGDKLNPEQCRAVFTLRGPLLVLAGAGSGKTTVLVNRISYLIKYGNAYFSEVAREVGEDEVRALEEAIDLPAEEINAILPDFITEPCPPWQVLAITFTNKAAKEIKERLARTFDDSAITDAVWAGTFHSVCMRILRKYADRLGYRSSFSIYDTDDQKRLLISCIKDWKEDADRGLARRPDVETLTKSASTVLTEISRAKERLVPPEDYLKESSENRREGFDSTFALAGEVSELYKRYQKKLMEYNAVDFDDIIMKTVTLLKDHADIREYYQNKFRYVLVDEYQDTNYAQFVLTSLLADKYRNIMVVGDDDQSIYRFRGATVENILNFDKTYPDATVVKLEQNYRSTEVILEAANAVIKNNDKRHAKRLWCDKGEGERIVLHQAENQIAEGRYIVEKIINGVRVGGRKYSDFAVLYRVNELARSLETSFAKSGIPYKILGSMRFYDRKEIKDIAAYLQIMNSPDDAQRLKRVINEPKRKIGETTVAAVEDIARSLGVSMYEVLLRAHEFIALGKSADKLYSFVQLVERIKSEHTLPSELITAIFNETGYKAMLEAEGFEGEGRIASVEEFISAALEYEKRASDARAEPTLAGFLEEISLVSDVDKYDTEADAVVLMTVHSAKGLEFPVVFLAGMEEDIFPSAKSKLLPEELSEERRLAYVAITRAKEKLYMTYAASRMMYGRTTNGTILSRFAAKEIPAALIERDGPKAIPPRASLSYARSKPARPTYREEISHEMTRRPEIGGGARGKSGAENYGIERIPVGARVRHATFGDGEIISSRDLGGDVLYEVKFDTGAVKKLMSTFAKLRRI